MPVGWNVTRAKAYADLAKQRENVLAARR